MVSSAPLLLRSQDEHDGCDPRAKSAFEISPARESPNVPAMISIARGNEVNTTPAKQSRSAVNDSGCSHAARGASAKTRPAKIVRTFALRPLNSRLRLL